MGSGSAHRDAGISQHERVLSELCSPRVAGAETARTPPYVDRHMSAVAHGGGRGGKGERCAARRSAERYRPHVVEGIGQALAGARDLRGRIAASDLAGARKAWIAARAGWERSEVFTAGFVPELDAQIDAWPNAQSGFHAIEAKLFGANQIDVESETDALVDHLSSLHGKLHDIDLTPQGLLDGTVRLAYEVGESKSDGGESRISGTSLDDMRNNVDGIELAYRTIFAGALKSTDPNLADAVDGKLAELRALLVVHNLPDVDIPKLRRASEELVVALQNASAKLGLRRPTLEAAAR